MGYLNPDPYHQPEKFGLTQLHEMNDPDACWSFDIMMLWRHDETGALYWAQDSGCSCPSPFEYHENLASLNLLTNDTWDEFEAAVNDWCSSEWHRSKGAVQAERTTMLATAAEALRTLKCVQ